MCIKFQVVRTGSLGGAMVQDGTTFTVVDTIFDLNRAQSQGGAVYQV